MGQRKLVLGYGIVIPIIKTIFKVVQMNAQMVLITCINFCECQKRVTAMFC